MGATIFGFGLSFLPGPDWLAAFAFLLAAFAFLLVVAVALVVAVVVDVVVVVAVVEIACTWPYTDPYLMITWAWDHLSTDLSQAANYA